MRPSATRLSGWGSAGGGRRPGSPARTRSTRSKNWRDRLIGLAARHPDWVVGYVDEVWWSRLAQPAMHAWGETLRLHANEPRRVSRRRFGLDHAARAGTSL